MTTTLLPSGKMYRGHRLNRTTPARLDDPTVEQLRECIRAGYCWWCDSGPWKMLAGHTFHAHGITAAELRRLAYLYKKTPICSPEHSDACRNRPQCLHHSPEFRRKTGGTCVLSKRAKIEHTERLMAIATNEQRREAGQKAAMKARKPHPCPVCGTILPTAHPITCSPECRKVVRQKTMSKANTPEVREKAAATYSRHYAEGRFQISGGAKPHPCPVCRRIVPTASPIACSLKCRRVLLQRAQAKAIQYRTIKVPREDYPKIAEHYWSSESATVIAAEYGVTPRFIRAIAKEQKVSV